MRTLSAAGAAQLGRQSALTLLIEMQLSAPVYVNTSAVDIDWGGRTYIGGRSVSVDTVNDQGGEMQQLRFTLSGVPSEYLALALAEPIQGKRVIVSTALMAPDTQAIVDVMRLWTGTLDQMPIKHGAQTSAISVTAEHRGIAFSRPKGLRYSDADQRRAYAGDRALEYLVAQSTHQDVWPSAAYGRQ